MKTGIDFNTSVCLAVRVCVNKPKRGSWNTSCSECGVDHRVSGCKYFDRCLYVPPSQQNLVGSVALQPLELRTFNSITITQVYSREQTADRVWRWVWSRTSTQWVFGPQSHFHLDSRPTAINNCGVAAGVIPSQMALNPLQSRGNYSATSNNIKLVHWPLIGGLLQHQRPVYQSVTVLMYIGPLLCGFNVAIKG